MRIAVTTTDSAAHRVADPLRLAGIEPVLLPCIRVEPADDEELDRLRAAAAEADWIVVTSARTVLLVWPDGDLPDGAFAAVGPATADAVEDSGGRVELVGDAGAAGLARTLATNLSGATVAYPAARRADPRTVELLEAAGASVITGAAYSTVPIAPAGDAVDGAVFGSPSAVEGWMQSRTLDGLEVVAAMGPTTASALVGYGRRPEIVPDPPRLGLIVAALARHLAERSRA